LIEDPARIGAKPITRIFLPEAVLREEATSKLEENANG
jgi:hypothetical protein